MSLFSVERESRVSSESRRALFSEMLFLLLFHCSNTQMDSPLYLGESVCLSVSPSMCLSVTQLTWQRKQVHPCTPRDLSGFLMGMFQSRHHAGKRLNFSPSLSGVFSQLLQMHSGPEVIGNAMTACQRNNVLACFGSRFSFGGRGGSLNHFLPL